MKDAENNRIFLKKAKNKSVHTFFVPFFASDIIHDDLQKEVI